MGVREKEGRLEFPEMFAWREVWLPQSLAEQERPGGEMGAKGAKAWSLGSSEGPRTGWVGVADRLKHSAP